MKQPSVKMGKPELTERFSLYGIDGINVYIAQNVQPHKSGISIFLKKFLWIKELAVDGIYVEYP